MYKQHKISTWAVQDRPVEKLIHGELLSLSKTEILSIIIGTGTKTMNSLDIARSLLSSVDNDLNKLAKKTIDELTNIKGIGKVTASKIIACFEIGSRKKTVFNKNHISRSQDVYNIFNFMQDFQHEEFWILLLNRSNKIIEKVKISQGGTSGTVVDNKLILNKAIIKLASAIICVHNHPSGNMRPSNKDKNLTTKIKSACLLMNITLLDHIIIGQDKYLSFSDEGLI